MIPDTKPNGLRFDARQIKNTLLKETQFIKNLFSILPIPTSALQGQDNEDEQAPKPMKLNGTHGKTRAQSLTELQDRLKNVQSKKKLNYKEKLEKKGLKNRLKKKTKREERNQKQKLVRMAKLSNGTQVKSESQPEDEEKLVKTTKPVFNRDGKMVFSKFDFSGLGNKNEKKTEKDPKKILKNIEKQKSKLAELEAKGEKEKAAEIKEKQAWKNALAKSEGQKVKDDPYLLKKSIKKREQTRKSSKKKWEVRKEGVKKAQDSRQAKRQENLDKRKKEKKVKTMKKAVKKGKIIPGF